MRDVSPRPVLWVPGGGPLNPEPASLAAWVPEPGSLGKDLLGIPRTRQERGSRRAGSVCRTGSHGRGWTLAGVRGTCPRR